MYNFIPSGIISNSETIQIANDELLDYLQKLLDNDVKMSKNFESYKKTLFFFFKEAIIEYFVKVLDYIIIYNGTVYFQEGVDYKTLDKITYVKKGYKLEKLSKMVLINGMYKNYISPIKKEIECIGFEHSISQENELSFWYPKTSNLGFKVPNTIIISFTPQEVDYIKTGQFNKLNEYEILERIKKANNTLNLESELFMRLGTSSNKFNFSTCHINSIHELFFKLLRMLDNMYFKLEWHQSIELVLREYIHTNYYRATIYKGMPLNTEFRVFYDFDTHELLNIFNYWDTDSMLDNLHEKEDLITFANTANEIENHFNLLRSTLEEEVKYKLPNAKLTGRWSIDFLYDGKDFVLIDMAHAECSYYYDKVLKH